MGQMANCITITGNPACTGGAYVLYVRVAEPLRVRFGRFRYGQLIAVPAGGYLYVGSALGRGATALAGRLLRHATRANGRPPHALRDVLAGQLAAAGLHAPTPANKRLHWHIDYLLDEPAAELDGVYVVCTAERLEAQLVDWLAARPGIVPLATGLGASDDRGRTHLLRAP